MLYIKSSFSITVVRETLGRHNISAKKKYGQNFLVDENILRKIADAGDITDGDLVVEIGPGLGALTAALAERAGRVVAVEIDSGIIPPLRDNLSGYDNVEIVNADFLKLDLCELISSQGFKSAKIVANLPYYITTPIIFAVLESKADIESMVVMVQKEVGDRMNAKPSTKQYGALTLAVGFYADVSVVANVPPDCFYPKPDVDSIVLKLELLKEPRFGVKDPDKMFKIIKAAFAMRRKTLANCLFSAKEFGLAKDEAINLIKKIGLSENVRGEALTPEQFAILSNELKI